MKKTRVVSIALAAIIAATGAMPSAGATAPEDFLKGYGYHVRLVPTEKCETVKENTKSFFENRDIKTTGDFLRVAEIFTTYAEQNPETIREVGANKPGLLKSFNAEQRSRFFALMCEDNKASATRLAECKVLTTGDVSTPQPEPTPQPKHDPTPPPAAKKPESRPVVGSSFGSS